MTNMTETMRGPALVRAAQPAALYIALVALALAILEGGVLGVAIVDLRRERRASSEDAPVTRSMPTSDAPPPMFLPDSVPITEAEVSAIYRDVLEREPSPTEAGRFVGLRIVRSGLRSMLARSQEAASQIKTVYLSSYGEAIMPSCREELVQLLAKSSMRVVRSRIAADASGSSATMPGTSACPVRRRP